MSELVLPKGRLATRIKIVPKKSGVICDGYEKVSRLGQGTYGDVWEAKKGNKRVAAKIVEIPEKDGFSLIPGTVIKEIDLLTRLRHPNVMTAASNFYLSPVTGKGCFITPLMGMDFAKVIRLSDQGERPYNNAAWLAAAFKKMLCGLAYLHTNFVIHCDLKPENVLYDPDTDSVRLTDYGMCVIFGSSGVVKYSDPIMTDPWRPPELAAMEASDFLNIPHEYYFGPEVDVYSMAWIGLEMLVGILPPWSHSDAAYYFYHQAIGGETIPEFSTDFTKLRNKIPDQNKYLESLANEANSNSGPRLDPLSPQKNYFQTLIGGRYGEFPDLLKFLDLLYSAILSSPEKRPTARELIAKFPNEFLDDEDFKCREITTSYPPFRAIEYHRYYNKEDRLSAVAFIKGAIPNFAEEAGERNFDSVILECIDLFDRISMVVPAKTDEEIDQNVVAAIYIATSLCTSWGLSPGRVTGRWKDRCWAESFASRLIDIIAKLKSRLYRPTLDQLGVLTTAQALEISEENLSPSRIESVSSRAVGWFPTLWK